VPLVLAQGAGAAVITERDSVPVPPDQGPVVTAEAKCPRGSNVVSGSFEMSAGVAHVLESRRVGKRAWRVTAGRYTNDLSPATLTAFAHCDRKASRAKAVTQTFSGNDEEELVGATSTCPGSRLPVFGGFRMEGTSTFNADAVVTTSRRSGRRGWRTEISPFSSFATVHGIAYCARIGRPLRKRATTKSAVGGDLVLRTPRCPATSAVGFRAEDPQGSNPLAISALTRRRSRWTARAHDPDALGLALKLFAYCPPA
jgi:hypothetical protein